MSVIRKTNPIKFNYSLNGHQLPLLEEANYLGLTRFKMEKPYK